MPSSAPATHRSAVLLLIITAVLWSLGGVLVKSIEWPSMAKAGARSAIACIVLWSWLRRPKFTWSGAQLGAALAYAATVTFYVLGMDRTTAANTIFLQYTGPIYVALLSPLVLGERIRRSDWLCIAIALAGIALFFRDQFSPRGLSGIFCALASGCAYGTMIVLLRWQRDASPASALLLGNIITAAVGLPFAIGHSLPPTQAGMMVVLGVVQLGLPYLLFSIAIQRVTALEAVLLPMLEPILNPLWVALVHGEWPGPWSLVGGAFVLVAVILRGLLHTATRDQPATATATAGKNSIPSTTHS